MVSTLLPVTLLVLLISQSTLGTSSESLNDQSAGNPSAAIKANNQLSQVNPVTSSNDKIEPEEYVPYKTPQLQSMDQVFLYESFDDVHRFKKTWLKSEATKGPNGEFKYDGTWDIVVTHQKIRGDYGLRMRSKSKHHAISRKFDRLFNFSNSSPLIVQYDVQYRNGQECGGAYLKLLSIPSGNLSLINDQSHYTIMFGPDKCGSDHRLHFIFAHVNNKTGERREIHWKDAHTLTNLADIVTDGKWHLFRLYISPSNRFELSMDKRVIASGSLLTDFSPSVNAPKEIDDPNDVKPEDWDERENVPDPDAIKPDDWDNGEPKKIPDLKAKKPKGWLEDESLQIPDPDTIKPENWSEDKDGSWEAPMIKNPRCSSAPGCGPWRPPMIDNPRHKGEWTPPLIPNPAYQGKWVPQKILNPDYFEDNHPYTSMTPIDAITFELWTLSDGIVFDNILVTSDYSLADSISMSTYQIKKELNDLETDNWFKRLIKQTNKKPWLWAVYIMATAVPVIFFIGFCCVTPGSSSTPSSTCSPTTSSSIFDCSPSSSASSPPSTTISDSQHCHHHQQPSNNNSCKANHSHEQYAFRYHDAYNNNNTSGCSSSETLNSNGLRTRFVSSSTLETSTSGYCSSSYQYHSQGHQVPMKTSKVSFRSACMRQVIPDEEEEEDKFIDDDEMRFLEEEEQNEGIDSKNLNYDDDDDDNDHDNQDNCDYENELIEDDGDGDYEVEDQMMNEIIDSDYNQNDLEIVNEPIDCQVNEDHLITTNYQDNYEDIDRDRLTIINNSKQYNNGQINESDDQLRENFCDDNYDYHQLIVDDDQNNESNNIGDDDDCLLSMSESNTNGLNQSSNCDDVCRVIKDVHDNNNDEQLTESVKEIEFKSHVNTSKPGNPSIRRRKKGKGRRKVEAESGPKEGSGNGNGGKSGRGKSRRTKARRE